MEIHNPQDATVASRPPIVLTCAFQIFDGIMKRCNTGLRLRASIALAKSPRSDDMIPSIERFPFAVDSISTGLGVHSLTSHTSFGFDI